MKRSCVLGVSKGVNADEVAQILIDNPFGNGSQKTPVVVIKTIAEHAKEAKNAFHFKSYCSTDLLAVVVIGIYILLQGKEEMFLKLLSVLKPD